MIATENLKDFRPQVLEPMEIEAIDPDRFVLNVADLPGGDTAVRRALEAQSAGLRKPPIPIPEIVDRLERAGLVAAATRMREFI